MLLRVLSLMTNTAPNFSLSLNVFSVTWKDRFQIPGVNISFSPGLICKYIYWLGKLSCLLVSSSVLSCAGCCSGRLQVCSPFRMESVPAGTQLSDWWVDLIWISRSQINSIFLLSIIFSAQCYEAWFIKTDYCFYALTCSIQTLIKWFCA